MPFPDRGDFSIQADKESAFESAFPPISQKASPRFYKQGFRDLNAWVLMGYSFLFEPLSQLIHRGAGLGTSKCLKHT